MELKKIIGCLLLLSVNFAIHAQQLSFRAEEKMASPGDTVRVGIIVENFSALVSIQYTFAWDKDVLEFLQTADYALPSLSGLSFAEAFSPEGYLPLVWIDNQTTGVTLPNGTAIFNLVFKVNGTPGDSSRVAFTGQPTPFEIGQLDGISIKSIQAVYRDGIVRVFSNAPQIQAGVTDNLCRGETNGSIVAGVSGGFPPYQFQWSGPDGFTASEEAIFNLRAGDYTLTVTDGRGNTVVQTFTVGQPAEPLAIGSLLTTPAGCTVANGGATVSATGGTPPYSFDFGNGFTGNPGAGNLAPGNYTLTLADANDCLLDTMFIITETAPPVVNLGADTALCDGNSLTLQAPAGMQRYRWSFNAMDLPLQSAQITIEKPGIYEVEVTDEAGCNARDTLVVTPIEVEAGAYGDTTITFGGSAQLGAFGGVEYLWQPLAFLSCQTCDSPLAQPTEQTLFLVDITTAEGCRIRDSVLVEVMEAPEDQPVIPVTFISPNDDGFNDVLRFEGLDLFNGNQLTVYNRWGNVVFSKPNYQIDGEFWDGTLRGKPLPAGIYFYVLKVSTLSEPIQSSLTIVRD